MCKEGYEARAVQSFSPQEVSRAWLNIEDASSEETFGLADAGSIVGDR